MLFYKSRPTEAVKIILLSFIFILAIFIRYHNLIKYNTWWADDGGAHVGYVQTILRENRLPEFSENYIAWHEPLYYAVMANWARIGEWLKISGLDWWEFLQVIISLFFLWMVWILSRQLTKNDWLSLIITFLFSVLFVGVKLSAFVTNELAVHALMLAAVYLWFKWQLAEFKKLRLVASWSFLVGIAILVKTTAVILILAAILIWVLQFLFLRRIFFLGYAGVCLLIVVAVCFPWFQFKQKHFGTILSINPLEQKNSQSIFKSDAWHYLFSFNEKIFSSSPYWYSLPSSFVSIALSDTFGDYYNLFNNQEEIKNLPANSRLLTGNGRFTTIEKWQTMIRINRIGGIIAISWLIGFGGSIFQLFKGRFDPNKWWPIILILGGAAALIYYNLRFPYLERGFLKIAFIYFSLPLLAIESYFWWWKVLKSSWLRLSVIAVPIVIYFIVALPILLV